MGIILRSFYRVLGPMVAGFLAIFVALAAEAQTPASRAREQPMLGSTITVDALGGLPSSANLLSLLDAAQSDVISDRLDTGGLSTGEASRLGAHGSSWTETRFRVGAASLTDPEGLGAPMLLPGVLAWDRVEITTGLMPIDLNAPGLAVTLVPRRPSLTRTRVLEGLISRPGMLSRTTPTKPPAIARLNAFSNGSLFLSGPIVAGRLGVATAASWTRASRFERDNPTRLDGSAGSIFTHIEFTPRVNEAVRTVVWVQRTRSPFANRNRLGQASAAQRETGVDLQSTWERQLGADLSMALFGSYTVRDRVPDVAAAPSIVIERLRDGPVPALLNPLTGTNRMWSAGLRVVPPEVAVLGRSHVVRLGIEASGGVVRSRPGFAGRVGELVGGLPARVWEYDDTGRDSRWHETTAVVYASDRVAILPRVQLDVGVRFESASGGALNSSNHVRWNNWFPRGSFRWEITDAAGLAAFVGLGRYGYQLPLRYFAFGDGAAQVGRVSRWKAATGDHAPLVTEIGELIARVGPGTGGDPSFSAIDPGLRRPYMDEFVAGFESRPRPSAVIRLAAIARREKQLVGLVNVGVPVASYTVVHVPDPGIDLASAADDQMLAVFNRSRASFGADRYLLTNPADDQATFVGIDFTGQTSINRLFLLAGGTAGRSEGLSGNRGFQAIENDQGVIGELFTNPNARTYAQGRLFTERGYTLKTAGVYRFPKDVRLGIVGRYQDGQHFARLVIVPGLNQGPEAIRAFRNGRTRFTYSLTVDVRLQKGFTLGAYHLDAIADAYNLLNTAKEVEEYQVTGSAPRVSATAVQPPRAIHLGLRIAF